MSYRLVADLGEMAASCAPSRQKAEFTRDLGVRVLRRVGREIRSAGFAARARWLKFRGEEAAARALLRAQPELALRILRALGAQIGEGSSIRPPLHLLNPRAGFEHLAIGRDVWIGPDVLFDLAAHIDVGHRATLSARASIVTHINVGASQVNDSHPPATGAVSLGEDAYLGTGATVLHGCRVGEGALVAAAALVRHSVPAHTLVAGVPARVVRALAQP